jgi:hypothetical protein
MYPGRALVAMPKEAANHYLQAISHPYRMTQDLE